MMKCAYGLAMFLALSLNVQGFAELTDEMIATMTDEQIEKLVEEGDVISIAGIAPELLVDPNNPYERYYARQAFEERFPERRSFNGDDLTFDRLNKAAEVYGFGNYEIKKSPSYQLSDEAIAQTILFKQDQRISVWENAVLAFHVTLSSPSQKSATANYGKALQSYFEKKVVGALFSNGLPGFAFPLPSLLKPLEAFKAIGEEYDRAKKASEGVAIRDFSVDQLRYASVFRDGLAAGSENFLQSIGNVNTIGPFAEAMKIDGTKLLDALNAEAAATPMERLFYDLTTMWINQSLTSEGKEPAHVVIKLGVDGATSEVKILAPSGDGIGEKLNGFYPNGTDIFKMKDVQVRVIQEQEGVSWPNAIVFVENGVVVAHPSFSDEPTETLAKHVYESMINGRFRFK